MNERWQNAMNWTNVYKRVTEDVQNSVHANIIGQILNIKNDIPIDYLVLVRHLF